ncbi:hypothetical protein BaRGS_00003343 [Batillaria attramentaria]|uniref:Uncharacterized protein n=1 Tax=Batillaria attramentaria TaxID=370345 RepID=A0ABD0M1N5_9CAEN
MGAVRVIVGRLCAIVCFLGTVSYMVGFSTPWWLEGDDLNAKAGLWQNCVGGHCVSTVKIDIGDWLIACQALSITALLTSLMSLGVVLVMLRASRPSAVSAARKGLIATTLITGLAASITLAVYYLRRELTYPADLYKISSSFCLALVGGALFLVISLVTTIDVITARLCHSSQDQS